MSDLDGKLRKLGLYSVIDGEVGEDKFTPIEDGSIAQIKAAFAEAGYRPPHSSEIVH